MRHTRNNGFTLIELMIVMLLIALLATIGLPNMSRARSKAQLTSCEDNIRVVGSALEMIAVKEGHYPADGSSNADWPEYVEKYIGKEPVCPSSGETYIVKVSDDGNQYTVTCGGDGDANHTFCDLGIGFPQYTSTAGLLEK